MMNVMMDTFMADGSPMATMADMMGSMMMGIMGEMTPGETDTVDDMAFRMGEMMQAFFVGVTGNNEAPALAMGQMMGDMMHTFMNSVTGDGETFGTVMQTMMDRFMADMQTSFETILDPMSDSINTFLYGMDANMDLISGMMVSANETLIDATIGLNDEYMNAMLSLSTDVMEMAGRVDEMVEKMADTQLLQSDNLAATQDNIQTLVESLSTDSSSEMFDVNVYTQMLSNLESADLILENAVSMVEIDGMNTDGYTLYDETILDYTAISSESTVSVTEIDTTFDLEGVLDTGTQDSVFTDESQNSMAFIDVDSSANDPMYYDPDANVFVIIPTDAGDVVQS